MKKDMKNEKLLEKWQKKQNAHNIVVIRMEKKEKKKQRMTYINPKCITLISIERA